jgi:hypothetical protein
VPTLSAQLVPDFGGGFSVRNLFRMIRFAEVFPVGEIVSTLSRQLGWSHFVEIIPLPDDLQRDFYAEMCRRCLERRKRMTPLSDRRHDAFANPAKRACQEGNFRVPREADRLPRGPRQLACPRFSLSRSTAKQYHTTYPLRPPPRPPEDPQ